MASTDQGFAPGIERVKKTTQAGRVRRLFQRFRPTISVDDASNTAPIVIKTKSPHFLSTGCQVTVTGVAGNTAANGSFKVTIDTQDASKLSLDTSVGNGDYGGGGSIVLSQTAHLVDSPKVGCVKEFIGAIEADTTVVKPIGNILLGCHANDEGNLRIKLFHKQAYNEKKGRLTDFDSLEESLRPLPSPPNPPNTPDPAKTIIVPDDLLGPNPNVPPHFVHLRGCNIGKAGGFLDEWRKALGGPSGKVQVTAPKHFHGVIEIPGSQVGSSQFGSWEYFAYEFSVSSPAVVRGREDRPGTIHNREDLISKFKADNADPIRPPKHVFIDGTAVDPDFWDAWIPQDIGQTRMDDLRVDFASFASTGPRETLLVKAGLIVGRRPFTANPLDYPNEDAGEPPPTDQREDALRQHLLRDAGHEPSRFSIEHPFSMMDRLGFDTLEDLTEGYSWNFGQKVVNLKNGKKRLVFVGQRVVYTLVIPVTSPNPGKKLDESKVLFNFFPDTASSYAPIIQIRQDDDAFFGTGNI